MVKNVWVNWRLVSLVTKILVSEEFYRSNGSTKRSSADLNWPQRSVWHFHVWNEKLELGRVVVCKNSWWEFVEIETEWKVKHGKLWILSQLRRIQAWNKVRIRARGCLLEQLTYSCRNKVNVWKLKQIGMWNMKFIRIRELWHFQEWNEVAIEFRGCFLQQLLSNV